MLSAPAILRASRVTLVALAAYAMLLHGLLAASAAAMPMADGIVCGHAPHDRQTPPPAGDCDCCAGLCAAAAGHALLPPPATRGAAVRIARAVDWPSAPTATGRHGPTAAASARGPPAHC
jgi:hypothetical protein